MQLRHTGAAFDLLNLGVHNVKLAAYQGNTLVDEAVGLLGHFILVLHSVVVVHGNQRVYDVSGTLLVGVFVGEREDGGHLINTAYRQVAYHLACHGKYLSHTDVQTHAFHVVSVVSCLLDLEGDGVVNVDRLAVVCFTFQRFGALAVA